MRERREAAGSLPRHKTLRWKGKVGGEEKKPRKVTWELVGGLLREQRKLGHKGGEVVLAKGTTEDVTASFLEHVTT